jgi:hypothetical protein
MGAPHHLTIRNFATHPIRLLHVIVFLRWPNPPATRLIRKEAFPYQSLLASGNRSHRCSSAVAVVYCCSSTKMFETCQEDGRKYFRRPMSVTCLSLPVARGTPCATRSWFCSRPRPGCGVRSISVRAPKENAAARVPPPENASPTITSSEPVVLSRPTTSAAAELSVRGRLTGSLWTSNAVHPASQTASTPTQA